MTKIYQSIEHIIAKIMFFLTIFFLWLVAILVQYLQIDNGLERLPFSQQIIAILWILWPIFFLERLLYLICCDKKTWKNYVAVFVITFLPPLRIAAKRCNDTTYIWWNGNWQLVNQSLYEHLEKNFLYPILFISFFMIPFWVTEILFSQIIDTYFVLYHLMNLGNALVWGLFVIEFIIMFSITQKRSQYLITHWLEIFIIILPILALTRFFIISKYVKISKTYVLWFVKAQDMLNIYRARVVINRIIRILIIIDIVKRFYQRKNPEKYLEILRDKLTEQEQELADLKKQIRETEILISKTHQ